MSDGAVVVHPDSSKTQDAIEVARAQARTLELQVARQEAKLRRAHEENAILEELKAVNDMILHKDPNTNVPNGQNLVVSIDKNTELVALCDAIKLEQKRTLQYQEASAATEQEIETVEKAIEDKSARLAIVKRATCYDEDFNISRGGAASLNEFLEKKMVMTKIHDEQKTVKEETDRLTEEIERINQILQEQQSLEEKFNEAKNQLAQNNSEYYSLLAELKSAQQIAKKKERQLEAPVGDDYRVIRSLEGSKKVLNNDLHNLRESHENNTRSIQALDARIKLLEARLASVNDYLHKLFETDQEPMENIPANATEVPVVLFDEICQSLEQSRILSAHRDELLDRNDARVEQLERNVVILQKAVASRAVSSQLHAREKDKEFEALMTQMDYMKKEFEDDRQRLTTENEQMRAEKCNA